MATLIAAIKQKYESLNAGNFPGGVRPALYFGKAPQTNTGGSQVNAETGFVVFKGKGQQSKPMAFGRITNETLDIEWEIFYPSLADCMTTANAIRFNGGTAQDRAGFDGGSLPDLTAPPTLRDIVCVQEAREQVGTGKTSKNIHSATLRHRFCLTRSS